MTAPPLPPHSSDRPVLLVVRTAGGGAALDELARRLHDAAAGLQAATGTDVCAHLPSHRQFRARWQDTKPVGARAPGHRHCEIDLRDHAPLVIALLAGPDRPCAYGSPIAATLGGLLERDPADPAVLWTDDLSRLARNDITAAQLHQALQDTNTIAVDNHHRRIDPGPDIELHQRLGALSAAQHPPRRRTRT